jgi:hypothetical protein
VRIAQEDQEEGEEGEDGGEEGEVGAGDNDLPGEGMVAGGREGQVQRRRRREVGAGGGGEGLTGLLVDCTAVLVGFFTSLVPRPTPQAHGF